MIIKNTISALYIISFLHNTHTGIFKLQTRCVEDTCIRQNYRQTHTQIYFTLYDRAMTALS